MLKSAASAGGGGPRYNAGIVAGALMPSESREIARHLLDGVSEAELKRLLTLENILQKRSPATALRQAALIKKRLQTLTPEGWQMIVAAPRETAHQILLTGAINQSKLIGDFMLRVVQPRWQTFEKNLRPTDWPLFLEECQQLDETIGQRTASTRQKLGQVTIKCLVEAGYLESPRTLLITPTLPTPEVVSYLRREQQNYALKCLSIFDER